MIPVRAAAAKNIKSAAEKINRACNRPGSLHEKCRWPGLFYPSKIKIDLNQFLILGVRVHIK